MKVRIVRTILEEYERGIFEYDGDIATIYINSDVCKSREDIVINSPEEVGIYFTGGREDADKLNI